MKRYTLLMLLGALVFWSGPGAQAKTIKGDAYLGTAAQARASMAPITPA